jgi:hypothetical protein
MDDTIRETAMTSMLNLRNMLELAKEKGINP